ncbi:MAG: hypothetical protein JWQ11_3778 [Rhizobacter sp.]|nr:hypothetical protein [Rhizobacter sp.]
MAVVSTACGAVSAPPDGEIGQKPAVSGDAKPGPRAPFEVDAGAGELEPLVLAGEGDRVLDLFPFHPADDGLAALPTSGGLAAVKGGVTSTRYCSGEEGKFTGEEGMGIRATLS